MSDSAGEGEFKVMNLGMRKGATASLAVTGAVAIGLAAPAVSQTVGGEGIDPLAALPGPNEAPSVGVTQVTNWVTASRDNGDRPFIIIDKERAEVFVFDAVGSFVGKTPALIGSAKGDDSVEGIGDRELSRIKPAERTTPAGRFVAKYGSARGNPKVLWVDYSTSISLHPVVRGSPKERRLQRLKSTTPEDNRATFGCINVDVSFYTNVVRPLFSGTGGIVYILPETRPLHEVFLALQSPGPQASEFGR